MSKGFILITILMFFVLLAGLVAVYLFISTTEMRQAGNALLDAKALAIAEAGLQMGIREIRDDVLEPVQTGDPSSLGFCASPSIDGSDTTGSTATNPNNALTYTSAGNSYANLNLNNVVRVRNFLQIVNLIGSRQKVLQIGCRYRINSTPNTGTMSIVYTTNNWVSSQVVGNVNVTSTTWTTGYFALPLSAWGTINNSNFGIGVIFTSRNNNNARIFIDYLFMHPTYAVDASSEPWFNGFVNIPLGDGVIQSVSIVDECGKVHLNYASQALLRYLMFECGIPDANANTLATNIINYRATKMFDSVEELQAVTGMTSAYYELIKNYITVYSFVNSAVFRPTGSRAAVNLNTAPRQVLEAIFDPLGLGGGLGPTGDAARVAQDIIAQRQIQPFTYFYSSDTSNLGSFYAFVNARSYLTTAEKRIVWENADAANQNWSSSLPGGNCVTTEFSYYATSFNIDAVGTISDISRHLEMVLEDTGSQYLDTYLGDTRLTKYWREIP